MLNNVDILIFLANTHPVGQSIGPGDYFVSANLMGVYTACNAAEATTANASPLTLYNGTKGSFWTTNICTATSIT